jgi:hypothetical protein
MALRAAVELPRRQRCGHTRREETGIAGVADHCLFFISGGARREVDGHTRRFRVGSVLFARRLAFSSEVGQCTKFNARNAVICRASASGIGVIEI